MDAKTLYDIATSGVASDAMNEANRSQMPGRENGPADAYRHLLLSAELTRRYGEEYARALLDGHEWTGNNDGQTPDQEAMDRHNNDVGIEIGKELRRDPNSSWDDVLRRVREKFDPSNSNGDGARWLPEENWIKNPIDEATGQRMPNNDPQLNWPPEWPDGPFPVGLYPDRDDPLGNGLLKKILDFFIPPAWGGVENAVSGHFSTAQQWIMRRDPLVLDLDGDGIETVAASGTSPILFDHNGDGIKTGTGWVKSDDGFLVLDRNGNGSIDSGAELFGIDTAMSNGGKASDGFAALRDLDSNGDGAMDVRDTRFGELRVWRDLDQDGVSDAGELQSLSELGIVSINLNATASNRDLGNGNVQTAVSTFTRTDGSTGTAANLNLVADTFHRGFWAFVQPVLVVGAMGSCLNKRARFI